MPSLEDLHPRPTERPLQLGSSCQGAHTRGDHGERRFGSGVQGFRHGADDYLCKPFDLAEFEARVRAFMRRGHGASVRIGALEWYWDTRQGLVGGTMLELSKHETTALESLLQAPGKIVPKTVLARRMGDEVSAADNMVEVYIHRLRKKLAQSGVEIRTVRGLGYALRESIEGA